MTTPKQCAPEVLLIFTGKYQLRDEVFDIKLAAGVLRNGKLRA